MKHIWKIKGRVLSKWRNCGEIAKVIFKNHRNCSQRTSTKGRLFRAAFISYSSISMTGYVTAPPAFVHGKLHALKESRLCKKKIMSSYNFTAFFSILTRANLCVFRCAWYWVSKLICVQYDFNAVDFSEHRPEEVIHIRFFWHSVYIIHILYVFKLI